MRWAAALVGLLVCLAWAGAAQAYVLVAVKSGGVILVEKDGEILALELDGIWVPEAPRPGVKGHYRGVDARRYVKELLLNRPAFIREVAPRCARGGRVGVKVRIRLGEAGEYDLAVSLARAGLGLVDRATARDPEHLEAIYRAERSARVAYQGMHDGGYGEFARSQRQTEINFGVGNLSVTPGRNDGGLQAYLGDPSAGSRRGSDERRPMRSAVEAIRDWGSAMGLPPDASRLGF